MFWGRRRQPPAPLGGGVHTCLSRISHWVSADKARMPGFEIPLGSSHVSMRARC